MKDTFYECLSGVLFLRSWRGQIDCISGWRAVGDSYRRFIPIYSHIYMPSPVKQAKMRWQSAQSIETQLVNSIFQETIYYGINGVNA